MCAQRTLIIGADYGRNWVASVCVSCATQNASPKPVP